MNNSFLDNIYRKRSQYNHPDQASTQAQSLNLLSSGIYTEEERFVFELLQNAVDAYEGGDCLNVKIVLKDGYLIFMHNGEAFSERDVDGLCDVGHGNKMSDTRKIGYKGIGFKSVFMHSKCVTVKSGPFCFRFEKDRWNNYWDEESWGKKVSDTEIFMPWQIIPIACEEPVMIDTDGYNVITYISSTRIDALRNKVSVLLSNSDFLLFLRHSDITVNFFDGDQLKRSVQKRKQGTEVTLLSDGKVDSCWMVYDNTSMPIDADVREAIKTDGITPIKLQNAETFDLSFAIPLNGHHEIESLKNSCVYTYLPTSISFDLPFLVNANFITDAGRQHLVNDSEWNKMIIKAIPGEFLNWMAQVSTVRKTYYRALPLLIKKEDKLSVVFDTALQTAINKIAFIPSISQGLLKADEAIMDRIGISDVVPSDVLLHHIESQYKRVFNENSFINKGGINVLKEYGVFDFDAGKLGGLFDDPKAFEGISVDKDIELIKFLHNYYVKNDKERSILKEILPQVRFLYAEDDTLDCPNNLFFPSNYRDKEAIAKGAKILHSSVYEKLSSDTIVINWLKEVGLCEMNEISIIKNLLTSSGYITKENAIEVGRYLFRVWENKDFTVELTSYQLSSLKFLSCQDSLKKADELYLSSKYFPALDLQSACETDIFVSEKYCDSTSELTLKKWHNFFRAMKISDDISLRELKFEAGSDIYYLLKNYVTFAVNHEYNHSSWTGQNYYMHFEYINVKYVPYINVSNSDYRLAKLIWTHILSNPVELNSEHDYIYGSTGYGYIKYANLCDKSPEHDYLGMNFLPWVIKKYQTFPASNGQMLMAEDLYKNTPQIKEIFGEYLPYIDIDCEIDSSWNEILQLKLNPTLSDYLTVLTNIAKDEEHATDNKERVSKIYQRITSDFEFKSDKNAAIIKDWAETGRLLSKENNFCSPKDLRHITIDGFGDKDRVYIGPVENRSKVIEFLEMMGVKIITEKSVITKYEEKEERDEIKKCLTAKAKVLALLKAGEKPSSEEFDKALSEIKSQLDNTHFYHCSSIVLTYGDVNDRIEKVTFGSNSDFFYTGEIRLSKIDPLLTPLCSYLNLKGCERELLVTMFEDIDAIREYLKEKEYDISYLQDVVVSVGQTFQPTLNHPRTDEQRRRDIITGFKGEILIYEKLRELGYNPICKSISDNTDYDEIIEFLGNVYYCKCNTDRYDISFELSHGKEMLVEVKTTTSRKEYQENMPISYREISLIEECNNDSKRSYVLVRVFDINSETPDIFVFKGHVLQN